MRFQPRILLQALPLLCTCASLGAAAPSTVPEAVPVDGPAFQANLVGANADGPLTFELPGATAQTRQLAAADLCWWGRWAEARGQTQILLVDGSLIVSDIADIDKDRVLLDWNSGGSVKLPLETIAGIVFHPPASAQSADQLLAKLPTAAPDADRLLLLNGDVIGGEFLSLTDDTVHIRTASGKLDVRTDKISALAMNAALVAKPRSPNAHAWLGLTDGSRLLVSSLVIDGAKAQVALAAGPKFDCAADDICAIRPLGGRTIYLSDLKPASYQYIPLLDLHWPWHADRNVLGTRLRAGGQLYVKGLGMHSASRLTYDLAQPYRKFAAEVAIDDQTGGKGSVVFRIYTDDGSGHSQLKFDSPIIRGGMAPVPVSVDLAGVKRLSLLVDFANQGDTQAHADWLNARVLK